MLLKDIKIGFAMTGSFCTLDKVLPEIQKIVNEGAEVLPIISYAVDQTDTRFGKAADFKESLRKITGKDIISTITGAEPIGPKSLIDILVIAPCTGNTIAKIVNGITDTPVTMACKAHLRNGKPVVIAVSTNDALGANAKNIGILLNTKNIFFVPYKQDDPVKKTNSMVADTSMIIPTILEALKGKQIQPVLL